VGTHKQLLQCQDAKIVRVDIQHEDDMFGKLHLDFVSQWWEYEHIKPSFVQIALKEHMMQVGIRERGDKGGTAMQGL
jgi:hypothetical protein